MMRPSPGWYTKNVQQTIDLNNVLNKQAQAAVDAKEPSINIWEIGEQSPPLVDTGTVKQQEKPTDNKTPVLNKRLSIAKSDPKCSANNSKTSKFTSLKKALSIGSSEDRATWKAEKTAIRAQELRDSILQEEHGRWPDPEWRGIVQGYQDHVGMATKIRHLRDHQPLQYLHLLRAGYFEPIPIAWADLASNPLKFSIESAAGWRGITPAWRGYEDTAEERLYWVLNHRDGISGARLKPDLISAMDMARRRMDSAVEPPPIYFAADDTCHVQHTSEGYSRQVMPAPLWNVDAVKAPTDDTMILLDISGSMDFDPVRPIYDQYLITGYGRSTQPKNKGV